jgi:hypothetical protein
LAVIVVSAVLLGASACSGSGSPSADPTTLHPGTAPPTSTTSPTSTQDPGQAAIAAVQRMFDAYNAMLKSGSSKAYRATFTKDCNLCSGDASTIEAILRKHQSIHGGQYRLSALRVASADLGLVIVEGTVAQAASSVLSGEKVVARYDAGKPGSFTWDVKQIAGSWIVADAELLS